MGEKDRLQKLIDWAKKGNRRVLLEFNSFDTRDIDKYISVFIYDSNVMHGISIKLNEIEHIDDIDIVSRAEERDLKEYKRLKAKYENNGSAAEN